MDACMRRCKAPSYRAEAVCRKCSPASSPPRPLLRQVIEAPLFDLEVRGIPALTYFGQQVWKG